MPQKIGPIVGSKNIRVSQAANHSADQIVEGVSSSEDVTLRQVSLDPSEAVAIASGLADLSDQIHRIPLIELKAIVQDEIGPLTVTESDVRKVDATLASGATASQQLKDSMVALAASSSIVAGGITLASLESPLAIAVALPLTAVIAGLCDVGLLKRLLQRIRDKASCSCDVIHLK